MRYFTVIAIISLTFAESIQNGVVKPIHFSTKNKKKDSLNFLLTGDWGWNGYNQTLTAYQMGVYSWLISAEFVIALGDNFYVDGVTNTSDPTWNRAFHDVYTSKYLKIPWFPILGNHDYHGNTTAQIERSKVDDMWTMPAKYYYYVYDIPHGGTLCIVYIDTQIIDPSAHDTESMYENPNWENNRKEHLEWIVRVLSEQNRTATWLLVAGHYPVYSIGDSGDNNQLITSLLPILKESNVHAYICGHDHNHQHIYKDNFHFIVDGSGGGRGPLGPNGLRHLGISAATNNMEHYFLTCGFSFIEATQGTLKINFVDNIGRIHYVAVLGNPFPNYFLSSQGISAFYTTNPTLSVFLILLMIAIPMIIIGGYGYWKMKEKSPRIIQKDTAIDVSERSTTSSMLFIDKEKG
mmetsp:Transcript_25231/g.25451  ORF Transcript_25231/g.25451 Transcript_25231/m.25451 type:complete len:406 (+) Transcript_25231:227-1444(+)|eukprot:CAMPEP_0182419676 /NCGR_PEP_ID=MMETSP1167-20130531/4078_1 /TAXON_ID=2988 /ORGANISM="Mallomonas Sp, Strain CCMP3275" /LENGTH=405 /DNA_ID=CAMNT_0024594727 /DNA_START=188 /DNA_END=1405 /DNA_ORIENTATION=-